MMMIDHARAKINLTLDIVGKRPDSYHELDMIMQTVEFSDAMVFETLDENRDPSAIEPGDVPVILELAGKCAGIPDGSDNLIIKAAGLLLPHARHLKTVRIGLDKHIPSGAGLGGGSADAACAFRVLSAVWDCDLSRDELLSLAAKTGADVPFLIDGGCCRCRGIGEILDPVRGLYDVSIVLVKPKVSLSTKEIYGLFDERGLPGRSDTPECIKALNDENESLAASLLGNALEEAAMILYPAVNEIKSLLLDAGAMGASMTGSGSVVYGIFRDKRRAYAATHRIREELGDAEIKTWITAPASAENAP
ncbi:MAG: 4-(cytidine 5'-diphospho)-2-C-methyl-D-erythritol kinase [Lachnospiraceae bacterium]|nr:4-(cytidine 5'-diphospho)-2-C-methyl-D-erythritol kinase [Lachnospiraceae bacterium]